MNQDVYSLAARTSGFLIVALFLCAPVAAFRYLEVGERIDSVELSDRNGASRALFRQGGVGVFAFIRPGQQQSSELVTILQEIRKRWPEDRVSWALLVSDSASEEHLAALPGDAELGMTVLIDGADALYGDLGVTLHPVVGIVDGQQRLRAYIPYRKVHLSATIDAYLAHTLGEISDDELAEALNPASVKQGGPRAKAVRHLRMAEMFLDRGNAKAAVAAADKSLSLDSGLQEAHAIRARAFSILGECEEARKAFALLGEWPGGHEVAAEIDGVCNSEGVD